MMVEDKGSEQSKQSRGGKGSPLEQWEDEMNICIRCGYCFESCPVLDQLDWDTDTARGKVILAYGLLNGDLEPNERIAEKLYQCTFCRDCVQRCSSSVAVPEILQAARAEMVTAGYASDVHEHVIDNVRRTGNIYGDTDVVAPVREGGTPVFLGCQYLSRPNKTKRYLQILEALGFEPMVQEEICCGFPMKALGFTEAFEEHKERFLERYPHEELIAFCPTCTMFLKEEYGLKAKHAMEVISERLPEANLGLKVTWHDPCDLSRGMGIIEEPRSILRTLGCEITEMENSKTTSRCCGGGGGILMSDEDLSDRIALDRVREALDTGADMLVTSCPTCEQVLKKAAQTLKAENEGSIKVRNIEDILWKGVRR